jgi:hypothetical protein
MEMPTLGALPVASFSSPAGYSGLVGSPRYGRSPKRSCARLVRTLVYRTNLEPSFLTTMISTLLDAFFARTDYATDRRSVEYRADWLRPLRQNKPPALAEAG